MKTVVSIILFCLLLTPLTTIAQNSPTEVLQKKEIAFLGVFHFAGTSDMVSMKIEDLASPKRQKEIKALSERLATMQPDKVILEYPYGKHKLDSLYQEYRRGNHELSINESQQLGFRIANLLDHEHIYPADYRMDIAFEPLMKYLGQTGQMHKIETLVKEANELMRSWEQLYQEGTLANLLSVMNSDNSDNENKNIYLQVFNIMGGEDNDHGIQVVSKWWERNFRIMKNIDMIMEPEDRALVIFGQGHTAIFKDLYKGRSDVEMIDIQEYLSSGN